MATNLCIFFSCHEWSSVVMRPRLFMQRTDLIKIPHHLNEQALHLSLYSPFSPSLMFPSVLYCFSLPSLPFIPSFLSPPFHPTYLFFFPLMRGSQDLALNECSFSQKEPRLTVMEGFWLPITAAEQVSVELRRSQFVCLPDCFPSQL